MAALSTSCGTTNTCVFVCVFVCACNVYKWVHMLAACVFVCVTQTEGVGRMCMHGHMHTETTNDVHV